MSAARSEGFGTPAGKSWPMRLPGMKPRGSSRSTSRSAISASAASTGGFVPLHGHANRPAIMVIAAGAITGYSTRAAAPKVRRAGYILAGYGDVLHWWQKCRDGACGDLRRRPRRPGRYPPL